MLETKVDLLKNRLYITLGRVRKDKVSDSARKIEVEIHKLEPGFTCITRIIDVREIDANDVRAIIEIQDLLAEHGISRAVRVGDDSGKELIDRIGKDVSYIALSADTLEEAEQILDEWESREA